MEDEKIQVYCTCGSTFEWNSLSTNINSGLVGCRRGWAECCSARRVDIYHRKNPNPAFGISLLALR